MLFCTSLIALVGAGEHPSFSPRRLQIINTKVILMLITASINNMRIDVFNGSVGRKIEQKTACSYFGRTHLCI